MCLKFFQNGSSNQRLISTKLESKFPTFGEEAYRKQNDKTSRPKSPKFDSTIVFSEGTADGLEATFQGWALWLKYDLKHAS